MTVSERTARVRLSAAMEPGQPVLLDEVERTSALEVTDRLLDGDPLLDPDGRRRRRLLAVDGAQVIAQAERAGVRFVVPTDEEWPRVLDDLGGVTHQDHGGRPVGLWVRSEASMASLGPRLHRSVSVVGSRAATVYGTSVATDWSADLAERDVLVVSGAAYGIDAAAHRGALAVAQPTVAVLAGGVDQPYPRGNAALIGRIAAEGWLLSEVAPGSGVNRGRFLRRNRLIAALGAATLVVEAGARSGALSTARWALHLLRPLAAVPGPVTSAMSVGTHELVREHAAVLVSRPTEVLELVGDWGTEAALPPERPTVRTDGLPETTMTVYEALPARGTVTVADLMVQTGLSVAATLTALDDLAARGLATGAGEIWRRMSRRVDP